MSIARIGQFSDHRNPLKLILDKVLNGSIEAAKLEIKNAIDSDNVILINALNNKLIHQADDTIKSAIEIEPQAVKLFAPMPEDRAKIIFGFLVVFFPMMEEKQLLEHFKLPNSENNKEIIKLASNVNSMRQLCDNIMEALKFIDEECGKALAEDEPEEKERTKSFKQ